MMQLDLSSLNVVPQEQHVDNIVKWSVFVNVRNRKPCKLGCKIIAEGCKLPFQHVHMSSLNLFDLPELPQVSGYIKP